MSVMLALVIYCHADGIFGSRRLERIREPEHQPIPVPQPSESQRGIPEGGRSGSLRQRDRAGPATLRQTPVWNDDIPKGPPADAQPEAG